MIVDLKKNKNVDVKILLKYKNVQIQLILDVMRFVIKN